jgi:hypothetical protein
LQRSTQSRALHTARVRSAGRGVVYHLLRRPSAGTDCLAWDAQRFLKQRRPRVVDLRVWRLGHVPGCQGVAVAEDAADVVRRKGGPPSRISSTSANKSTPPGLVARVGSKGCESQILLRLRACGGEREARTICNLARKRARLANADYRPRGAQILSGRSHRVRTIANVVVRVDPPRRCPAVREEQPAKQHGSWYPHRCDQVWCTP